MARGGRPPKHPNLNPKNRPRRTRDHVIADLSEIHFQWIAAKCGYVADRPVHDYGYDLDLFTYGDDGEIENGVVLVQLKATDVLASYVMVDGVTIAFPVERQYVELWRYEPMPVILVIFDVKEERSYWLHTQPYFGSADFALSAAQATVSLHIPLANIVDTAAIRTFRTLKNNVLARIKGIRLYY